MYKVTIWVVIQMHYRSYNLIFQKKKLSTGRLYLKNANDLDLHFERSWSFSYKMDENINFLWKMFRFSSIYITLNGRTKHITN